jgi:hypothetical protein
MLLLSFGQNAAQKLNIFGKFYQMRPTDQFGWPPALHQYKISKYEICGIFHCVGVSSILTNTNITFQIIEKICRGTKIFIRKTVYGAKNFKFLP